MSAGSSQLARAVGCGIAALLALGLAACGGDSDLPGGRPTNLEKELIPAEVVDSPKSFFASEALKPVENAWRTSDKERFTQVEAGAIATDQSNGGLAIFRHEFKNAKQGAVLLKVIGAGALRITKAPTGEGAESAAQRNGKIKFTSKRGAVGTLDLKTDTISLKAP